MAAPASEFMQSPGFFAWSIFWVYLLLTVVGLYVLLQIFRENRIVYGHLDDLFRFLTRVRIWSIRYRKTYTLLITSVLSFVFLTLVYLSERLHSFFYQTDPVFTGIVDYLVWIVVFVVSGLQVGDYPQSMFGFLLSGVYPLFVIGSVFTVVRFTSERAHNALIKRMAEGDIAPHRIIVFNYREKYDPFIEALLNQSDTFVVIFAKDDHYNDALSFVEGIEETDAREYRMTVCELSYSEDTLFEQYGVLKSDELYIFPDAESRTDYENLRLVTRLNQEVSNREQKPNVTIDPPSTVWLSDSRKLSGVSYSIEQTSFKQRLHAMSFQDDVRDLIRINTNDSMRQMDEYFNFTGNVSSPAWVGGYGLDNYSFVTNALVDEELDSLDEIRDYRVNTIGRSSDKLEQARLAALKQETLEGIETRLRNEVSNDPQRPIGPFYGLLTEAVTATIPIDFASAYLNQQMETATDAIQIQKDTAPKETETNSGDVFIVNYNAGLKEYVLSFGEESSGTNRHLTVFNSANQVTPDADSNVNYAEYNSMMNLLDMLFSETADSPRRVEAGDTILLCLDHTDQNPEVNLLRVLDAIDDKLSAPNIDIGHNDVFLAVESDMESRNEEYRYLAVDKVIETHRTEKLFLHNLVQFRTSTMVRQLLQEGVLEPSEAFDWAVTSAYYFREYKLENSAHISHGATAADSVVGVDIQSLLRDRREFGQRNALPFTTFSLTRDGEGSVNIVLDELTQETQIEEGQFLVSLPQI